MEFLSHDKSIGNLETLGVIAEGGEGEDSPMRFRLDVEDAEEASIGPAPSGDAPRSLKADGGSLAELLDAALHAFHLQDVMVVPALPWRALLDLIAFDMAADEAWQDIDAEANLHARSRDPLLFSPDERETLLGIVRAALEHGEGAAGEFTILAVGSPVVIGVRSPGELRLSCPAPVMQTVMGKLEPMAG